MLAALEGNGHSNEYGELIELYKDNISELPLEVIRVVVNAKRTEAEDRERILRLVETRKLQLTNGKRLEVQVVEQLTQQLNMASSELRIKDQASQEL